MFGRLGCWLRWYFGLRGVSDIPVWGRPDTRFCDTRTHSLLCRCHVNLCPDRGICPCGPEKGGLEDPPGTVE